MRLRSVADRVVARAAPQEAPYYDLLADRFFSRKKIALSKRHRRPTPTGLGLPEVVGVITPIVLTVLTAAAQDQLKEIFVVGTTRLSKRIRLWWRRRRPVPSDPDADLPALPDSAVDERSLIEFVRVASLHYGATPEQAEAIAEAVRAELAPPDGEPA